MVEQVTEPQGWMRKWAFDGETPHKEKNAKGRWAWPAKFKFHEVTRGKLFPDDVALYARAESQTIAAQKEVIEAFTDAAIQALAYIASPAKDDYQLSLVKQKAETKLRAALELARKAQL